MSIIIIILIKGIRIIFNGIIIIINRIREFIKGIVPDVETLKTQFL